MKKVLVLGGFALLALASCKKEYTCECTSTTAGISASASTTIKDTKKNAEEICDSGDASTSSGGVTITTECTIK